MSRSGYIDDLGDDDPLALGRWRGRVQSAIRGKRGQEFLKEMLAALDLLPEKALIARELQTYDGGVCALGAWAASKGINMMEVDPEDYDSVANLTPIATCMVQEIVYINDEVFWRATPTERYTKVRAWIESQIKP